MPRQCNYFIIIIACMWVCVFGIHILDIFRITRLNKGVHTCKDIVSFVLRTVRITWIENLLMTPNYLPFVLC